MQFNRHHPLRAAPARSRYLTALGRLLGGERPPPGSDLSATAPDPAEQSRPWEIRKQIPGQQGAEVHFLAAASAALAVAASADGLSHLVPLGGWHWLWMTPVALAASFAVLALAVAASAAAGQLLGAVGALRSRLAHERNAFCFLCIATGYAAWTAASGRPVTSLAGALWITLATTNAIAAIYLAMKKAETTTAPATDS